MDEVIWSCACGSTRAALVPGEGALGVCYCRDCRGYAHHLGHPEILDEAGGTAVYATLSDRLRILEGAGNLACLRLTRTGPMRWYAACCNSPLANTAPTPRVSYVAVMAAGCTPRKALGRVRARLHGEAARGRVPRPRGGAMGFVWGAILRALSARLTGRWRATPFFDAAGQPIAPPRYLDRRPRAEGEPR